MNLSGSEVVEVCPQLLMTVVMEAFDGCFLDCPVDSNEEVQLALSSLYFGNIDVKKAYGIAFEALSFGLVSFDVRQPGYPVALKAAMQSRACQMGDAGLQGIKTVIQR